MAVGLAGALVVVGLLWPALQRSDRIGGPFTLTGENGQPVSSRQFRGKYELIYFGYTHCPDLCPLTLAHIAQALMRLGPAGRQIVPIFITIDPTRDTPTVLRQYTKKFSDQIIGLTGTPAEIAHVASEFHVYYRRSKAALETSDYDMDHSTSLYVMGPRSRFITAFRPPNNAETLVKQLDRIVGNAGRASGAPHGLSQ